MLMLSRTLIEPTCMARRLSIALEDRSTDPAHVDGGYGRGWLIYIIIPATEGKL